MKSIILETPETNSQFHVVCVFNQERRMVGSGWMIVSPAHHTILAKNIYKLREKAGIIRTLDVAYNIYYIRLLDF